MNIHIYVYRGKQGKVAMQSKAKSFFDFAKVRTKKKNSLWLIAGINIKTTWHKTLANKICLIFTMFNVAIFICHSDGTVQQYNSTWYSFVDII